MERLSLKPLAEKLPPEKPFAVFDIEAEPAYPGEAINTKFLGADVFDGERHYDCESERDLVDVLMSEKFDGYWIYAHNGSGYDFLFLFRELIRRKATLRAFRTGGRYFLRLDNRAFFDSAAILKSSLSEICEDLKLTKRKHKVPDDFFPRIRHYWPLFGREYMRGDCEALYEAIDVVRDSMRRLGCVLKPTLASTAMDLFRRQFLTRPLYPEPWDSPIETAARAAYTGGRVENFKESMGAGAVWDITSCFPRAMLDPVPLELSGSFRSGIPEFGLVHATIDIPDTEYIPPIPWRSPVGKLYFPTGRWETWITSIEARAIKERYGSKAIVVDQAYGFVGEAIFKSYCQELFGTRQLAKQRGDVSMSYVCKLMLNTLYGKTATTRTREEMLFGEEYAGYPFDNTNAKRQLARFKGMGLPHHVREYSSEDHIYGVPTFLEKAPYIFPQCAAWITSHARVLQLQPLLDDAGSEAVYCDTDSIYRECSDPKKLYRDKLGDELGDLKLQDVIKRAEHIAPKLYWYERAEGTYDKPEKRYEGAAKGLPRKSFDVMKDYLQGKPVNVPRMFGVLETIARIGHIEPRSETQPKQIRTRERKRSPEGRAWRISELRAPMVLRANVCEADQHCTELATHWVLSDKQFAPKALCGPHTAQVVRVADLMSLEVDVKAIEKWELPENPQLELPLEDS